MFCPVCRSEYRRGIETCTTCEVALVAQLSSGAAVAEPSTIIAPAGRVEPLVEHCGFLALEDAREAREVLRGEGIRSEILIRDAAQSGPAGPPHEEFWLRVPASKRADVEELLGELEDPDEDADDEEAAAVACSDCGKPVAEDASTCPHCGAQFE